MQSERRWFYLMTMLPRHSDGTSSCVWPDYPFVRRFGRRYRMRLWILSLSHAFVGVAAVPLDTKSSFHSLQQCICKAVPKGPREYDGASRVRLESRKVYPFSDNRVRDNKTYHDC